MCIRDSIKTVDMASIPFDMGSLLKVNNVQGTPFINIGGSKIEAGNNNNVIDLHNGRKGSSNAAGGLKIGVARVYSFSLTDASYSADETSWDLYLFDIQTYTTLRVTALTNPGGKIKGTRVRGLASGAIGYLAENANTSGTNELNLSQTTVAFIEGEQIIFNEKETTEKVSIKNGTLAQPGVISYNVGDIKSVFQSKDKVESTLASDFSADAVLFDHVLPGFSVSDELNITGSNTASVNGRNFANTGIKTDTIIAYNNDGGTDPHFNKISNINSTGTTLTLASTMDVAGVCEGDVSGAQKSTFRIKVAQVSNYGKSSIFISIPDAGKKEISCLDEFGLFAREIEHASNCILEKKIESDFITHAETQSNMFWLDQWREKITIECPKSSLKNSPIYSSHFFKMKIPILKETTLPKINKISSRLALGCDNQTSDLHAFTMFDHFFGSGGRIFDTAYIYNNGKGDKYLGDWINSRGVANDVIVIGKAAHTPQCEPQFIRPQLIESLDRLKLSKIDIFCLHRDNKDVPVDEFVHALSEIRDEGLIDVLGASNWELDRFSEARNIALKNKIEPFSVLSNNFSLAEMIEPVWPGCVGVNKEFLEYLIKEKILLFPWSSQARGFFIKKKEQISNNHFSNPTLDEEMRVWHYEKNLKRRDKCFELAEKRGLEPIQIALAYVLHQSDLIFPLIGPRTLVETNSSIEASKVELTAKELQELSQA